MAADPVGSQILKERPLISSSTLPIEQLLEFPEGTLGRVYAQFMTSHQFQSDERQVDFGLF